jgi:sigma-B regulation protein RsbU (phosphoserine phosphatase)
VTGRDDHRWSAGAVAVLAILAGLDLALGPDVQFTGSLVIAPFLASAMVSPRTTLGVALLTLLMATGLGYTNVTGALEFVTRVCVITFGGILAIWLAARRERREEELADVTRVAEVAQRAVLTPVPRTVGPLAFASRYQSASPEALIGGDFYEVVERDDGPVRAVVGDVRGKGLDAVRLAAVVLGSFREAAQSLAGLDEVASLIDRRLRRHLDAEDFVTAVFAEFGEDGTLTVVNCGHHAPLLVRKDKIELLTPRTATTPLGLEPVPAREVATMEVGDRLLLYTDGLVEARSQSGRMISLEHLARTLRSPDLDEALGRLVETLQSLVIGPLEDDLAVVLAEYRGCGPAGDQPSEESRMVAITDE